VGQTPACPDRSDLQRLARGELSDEEADKLSQHILTCSSCADRLNALCVNDPIAALLARGESPLLARDSTLDALIERLAEKPPDSDRASTFLDSDRDAQAATITMKPKRLERYSMSRLHAQGGIGQVWLARDNDLGRDVALKELRPERARNPSAHRRFLDEARITGQLEHPAIVPVHELAKGGDGEASFYTMRFVRGRTLADAVRDFHRQRQVGRANPLRLRELLGAFVTVCNAVGYAHSRGVLHRDLKPHNIVLGDFGEVVVLDWGLAKLVTGQGVEREEINLLPMSTELGGSRDQTIQGQVLGTPAYMPPEQALGHLDALDQRSDVYGLGAILYELITGQPPFGSKRGAGGQTEESDTDETLRQVVEEAAVSPRQLVSSTPPALEAVCLKALAKNPADRYPSAKDVAQEIERWLADEPVAAYPEPWTTKSRRWIGKHRTLVTGLLLIMLGIVTGVVLWQRELQRREREMLALERAAEGSEKAALNELHAGEFASALTLAQRALEPLEDKPELGEISQRLKALSDEMRRLVEFYRLSDEAERLAFLEYDDEATDACEEALANLQIFEHRAEWPNELPAADLTAAQLQHLRRDAYRALLCISRDCAANEGLSARRRTRIVPKWRRPSSKQRSWRTASTNRNQAASFSSSVTGSLGGACMRRRSAPPTTPLILFSWACCTSGYLRQGRMTRSTGSCRVLFLGLCSTWTSRPPWLRRSNCFAQPRTLNPSITGPTSGAVGAI
jgi:serine/threonine protein kinase